MSKQEASGGPEKGTSSRAFVVYDKDTGEIKHAHECVPAKEGGSVDTEKLQKEAMEMASRHNDTENLDVADVSDELPRRPEQNWEKVDPDTKTLSKEKKTAPDAHSQSLSERQNR
jgi:hypothetical protein